MLSFQCSDFLDVIRFELLYSTFLQIAWLLRPSRLLIDFLIIFRNEKISFDVEALENGAHPCRGTPSTPSPRGATLSWGILIFFDRVSFFLETPEISPTRRCVNDANEAATRSVKRNSPWPRSFIHVSLDVTLWETGHHRDYVASCWFGDELMGLIKFFRTRVVQMKTEGVAPWPYNFLLYIITKRDYNSSY